MHSADLRFAICSHDNEKFHDDFSRNCPLYTLHHFKGSQGRSALESVVLLVSDAHHEEVPWDADWTVLHLAIAWAPVLFPGDFSLLPDYDLLPAVLLLPGWLHFPLLDPQSGAQYSRLHHQFEGIHFDSGSWRKKICFQSEAKIIWRESKRRTTPRRIMIWILNW